MKIFRIVCMVLMIAMMQHTCLAEITIIDQDNSKEWDAENKTISLYDDAKTKLMTVKLISARPDLCTFTEIYEVSNFKAYTPNIQADFNARINTVVGSGAVTEIEWFIEQNVSYVVNVTDYGIKQVEEIIYNNKTGKNETVLVNRTVIIGYHDETRYRDVWINYQPYDKEMKMGSVQRIKVVYHKVPELGLFKIQTVPVFRGVECLELTWWNGSWDRRRAILIDNTAGDSVTDYQLISENISSFGIDAPSSRIINSISGLQESFWNQSVDASGNLEYVWCNFSSLPSGGWINSTYYVYYQSSPSVGSASDGTATFPKSFSDFENDTLSDWTNDNPIFETSTEQVVSGTKSLKIYKTNSPQTYSMLPITGYDESIIVDFDFYIHTSSAYPVQIIVTDDAGYGNGLYLYETFYSAIGISNYYSAAHHYFFTEGVKANWYKMSIHVDPTDDTTDIWVNDSLEVDGQPILGSPASITRFGICLGKSTATTSGVYLDNLLAREYTANEPEPWTVGVEEEYIAPTPTPTPTLAPTSSVSPGQYDELDLPLILYILMISLLYLLIVFRQEVATIELSLIYLIFAFFFLLFQTVTMYINYIYLTLFLLLFMISIAGIILKQKGD